LSDENSAESRTFHFQKCSGQTSGQRANQLISKRRGRKGKAQGSRSESRRRGFKKVMLHRACLLLLTRRPRVPLVLQCRQLSVFDKIRGAFDNTVSSAASTQQDSAIENQMKFFADIPVFTLQAYSTYLEEAAKLGGAKGWRAILKGNTEDPALDNLKLHVKIGEEFNKLGVQIPDRVKGVVKSHVAKSAGTDNAEVNLFLTRFTITESMHAWVHALKTKGIAIPKTQAEFDSLVKQYPIQFPEHIMQMQARAHPVLGKLRARRRG
jgi:hypothetical protein